MCGFHARTTWAQARRHLRFFYRAMSQFHGCTAEYATSQVVASAAPSNKASLDCFLGCSPRSCRANLETKGTPSDTLICRPVCDQDPGAVAALLCVQPYGLKATGSPPSEYHFYCTLNTLHNPIQAGKHVSAPHHSPPRSGAPPHPRPRCCSRCCSTWAAAPSSPASARAAAPPD